MPPITPLTSGQPQGTGSAGPPAPSRRWVLLGTLTGLALCVVDVGGGFLVDRVSANISGTLALSPVLTGLGGSRRQAVGVGVLAVAAAAALALLDGVPLVPGLVRTLVVVAAAVLAVVAVGVRNAQLATLQDRRQAARTLQAAMLTRLPEPDHLQLTSRYLPASSGDQVGGDWYDALVDADGCTVLVIGDVTGHDIHAAAAMGQLRGLLRSYAVEGGQSPAQLLRRVDAAAQRLGLEVLATAVVARVEQDADERRRGARRLTWSNAGHPPPLLLTPADGAQRVRTRFLDGQPDLLLGLLPETGRTDRTVLLPPSATLLLYTDGLVERREQSLTQGLEHLARAAERVAARTDLDGLVDAVVSAQLDGGHQDDVAVLAVRAHPEDRPRPAVAGPERPAPGPPGPLPG